MGSNHTLGVDKYSVACVINYMKKIFQKHKKFWKWYIIACIIFWIFFITYLLFRPEKPGVDQSFTENQTLDERESESKYENCTDFSFTHHIMDTKYIRRVGPIGDLGSHGYIMGRSYVHIKDEYFMQRMPMYAPKNMTLVSMNYYQDLNAPPEHHPDYALDFELGCNISMSLHHLKEVVETIEERSPELNAPGGSKEIEHLNLTGGELIGYFILDGSTAAWDFFASNSSHFNQFANQARYGKWNYLLHRVCPYDFFRGQMKEDYYSLLPESGCGSVERDVAGTIAGQWFLDPNPSSGMGEEFKEGYYGNPLPIITGTDGTVNMRSIGTERYFSVGTENPSHMDPEEVTGEHCYQRYTDDLPQDYAYFKLFNDTTLGVFFSESGSCPDVFPEDNFTYYYR